MSVSLAATWPIRGELPRLRRLIGGLNDLYSGIILITAPRADRQQVAEAAALPGVKLLAADEWPTARHTALDVALSFGADAIHQADFDRVLHWLECYPDELRATLNRLPRADCLITGRTAQAWSTHPRCMVESEALFNRAFSHLLGLPVDVGAGSKVFSPAAARYVLAHTPPEYGWAIDAAWPLMLLRAGCRVEYVAVDGLEWETPDQFREAAADAPTRRAMAARHDADPDIWRERVRVADEIMRVGLLAAAQGADHDDN